MDDSTHRDLNRQFETLALIVGVILYILPALLCIGIAIKRQKSIGAVFTAITLSVFSIIAPFGPLWLWLFYYRNIQSVEEQKPELSPLGPSEVDRITKMVSLPQNISAMLPASCTVQLEMCRLLIKGRDHNGWFRVQRHLMNNALESEFVTQIPLSQWAHQGWIPQCISVLLSVRSGYGVVVGLYDLSTGSGAYILENIWAIDAFNTLNGRETNPTTLVGNKSQREREAIEAVMQHLIFSGTLKNISDDFRKYQKTPKL